MSRGLKSKSAGYSLLVRSIKREMERGRAAVRTELTRTYWNIGKDISTHILANKHRAGYGEEIFLKLEKSLRVERSILHRSVKLYETYPKVATSPQLSWSHFCELIPIKNTNVRQSLLAQTLKNNWAVRRLRKEIKQNGSAQARKRESARNTQYAVRNTILKAKPGTLYTYKVLPAPNTQLSKNEVLVDCGFDVRRIVPRSTRGVGAAIDYTYCAVVERVIDGDTLLVEVDLGLKTRIRQKLRLRGIDSEELKTTSGRQAKRYVQSRLKVADTITIKTHKSDKYDRYLVDVWAGEEYLNQELLDKGLAERY